MKSCKCWHRVKIDENVYKAGFTQQKLLHSRWYPFVLGVLLLVPYKLPPESPRAALPHLRSSRRGSRPEPSLTLWVTIRISRLSGKSSLPLLHLLGLEVFLINPSNLSSTADPSLCRLWNLRPPPSLLWVSFFWHVNKYYSLYEFN